MATTKTPSQLAVEATTLATSFEYVLHKDVVYTPVDFETLDGAVIPSDDRKVWIPRSSDNVVQIGRNQFDTLFKDETQSKSFVFMVKQESRRIDGEPQQLLIKTSKGLKVLTADGTLADPDGTFIPNYIPWMLNEDPDDIEVLWSTITEWVGGDEEISTSLMRHLATALAPHWSANKYVLFIGDGRNGKSVLMTMLEDLFGRNNCSKVTRQHIAEGNVATVDVTGKLLNVVIDGSEEYIKDSGAEKSLITGEAIGIRQLYKGTLTQVSTNALFIEGLNKEPKSRDKSSALQARLVRFIFPNKYADDLVFMRAMRTEKMLGALLALLIKHYVKHDEVAVMLAPTAAALAAQLDHMVDNSAGLQYLQELELTTTEGAEQTLIDMSIDDLARRFKSWRLAQGDIGTWDTPSVMHLFNPLVTTVRKSVRVPTRKTPIKVRVISGLKQDALAVLESMKEEDNAGSLVDDGHV